MEEQGKIQKYVNDMKELYDNILDYLENNEYDAGFVFIFEMLDFENDGEKLVHFLHILANIANNHYHTKDFFVKIRKILQHYKDLIEQNLSIIEIFKIFESNKMILLFLLEEKIITINETIYFEIINQSKLKRNKCCNFLYPELKKFIGEEKVTNIEKELLSEDPDIFHNFDEKRSKGENESYISSLIRQDLIKEFIIYVNQHNISLSETKIHDSTFETNQFLIGKTHSLIEYSAFFVSLQIFQYLRINDIELKPSLWLYAIHGNIAELIHHLENNKIDPPNRNYEICLFESIKCHHNDIAIYILNNILETKMTDEIVSCFFKYYNYSNISNKSIESNELYYICRYSYQTLCNLYIKMKEKEIKAKIIQNHNCQFKNCEIQLNS